MALKTVSIYRPNGPCRCVKSPVLQLGTVPLMLLVPFLILLMLFRREDGIFNEKMAAKPLGFAAIPIELI